MARSRARFVRKLRVRSRLLLRRLTRETPEWMRWATPWATSLTLHAVGLLLLAVVFHALGAEAGRGELPRIAGQLLDDVTSSRPGDRAGDPFTTLVTEEPPSLNLSGKPDADVISVPKLPESFVYGPALNAVEREPVGARPLPSRDPARGPGRAMPSGRVGTTISAGAFDSKLPLMAPFSGRSSEERARTIRREGGTAESEKSVELGLEWIARHQRPDGGWALETRPMCRGSACPGDGPVMFSDSAATGLALLPLLGAGHTHTRKGRYQATIQRGLLWLVKVQKPSGEIFTGGSPHTLYYSHAIASMALCEAYGITRDKRFREPAQKAIRYLNSAQNKVDGGWRYVFGEPSDTSVFGWQVFAMRSAHLAGLETNKNVLRRAREYLDRASADRAGTTYGYLVGRPATPTMTAEALVCRQMLGWPRDHPALVAGAAGVADHLEESQIRNIYYWYYATQLLHNMKNKAWVRWNERVRDGLISMQCGGKECDAGSWDPAQPEPDRWGPVGGRLYVTSLSLLTLEVYYRYLPLYRDDLGEMAGAEGEPLEAAGGS